MNPTSTNYQQLLLNLDYLKLKQMTLHLDEVLDFSVHNELSIIDTLIKLTSYEIDVREQSMTQAMVKVGAFPHRKEIRDFDFAFQPSINQQQILDFLTLRFLEFSQVFNLFYNLIKLLKTKTIFKIDTPSTTPPASKLARYSHPPSASRT